MRSLLALLPLALAACAPPAALEVRDAWARDTVGGTANAAVYLTIASPAADRLLAASTPRAARTDLMTMTRANGATGMAYLEAIDLPAGEPVALDPTGLHVWLDRLDRPLRTGERFALTLEFEHAGAREVAVTVIAPAAVPPGSPAGRR